MPQDPGTDRANSALENVGVQTEGAEHVSPDPHDRMNAHLDRLEEANESIQDEFRREDITSEGAQPDANGADNRLVQETRLQIRQLVNEIVQLVKSDKSPDEFLDAFVARLTSALASSGTAIWMLDTDDRFDLAFATSFPDALHGGNDQRRHALLLERIKENGEAVLVPPASGSDDQDSPGNPTPHLLVIAPIRVDQQVIGLVEVFQRSGTGPTTQRGYLRFLVQMCDLVGDYFKTRQLRGFRDQKLLWTKLDQFVHAIHRSLDQRETTFQIANEGRRVLDCDRLSVAVCRGSGVTIQAVSGLDSLDRRAADLKTLTRLTQAVLRAGEPLWFRGESDDLPPQIEKHLHPYVDRTHCKLLVILPLERAVNRSDGQASNQDSNDSEAVIEQYGALIIEQLGSVGRLSQLEENANVIAHHSADALANVDEFNQVPFVWLWKSLGKLSWFAQVQNLPVSIAITAVVVGIVVALCIVPASFELASEGRMTPQVRHDVFAPLDGLVSETFFPDDPLASIPANRELLVIENRPLEVEIGDLVGQEQRLMARLESLRRSLVEEAASLSAIDEIRLETEAIEAEQSLITVRRQLEIKNQQFAELLVRSPAAGEIGDWQVHERLKHRPVQRGQRLLTIVDPTGAWELELEVPEKQVGHLMRAQKDADEPLTVTFVLASDPASHFEGQISEIHPSVEVRENQQNIVLVKVAFDKQQIPDELRRHGTRVRARIDCGQRSLGYVLFHDVIETVQGKLLFWL